MNACRAPSNSALGGAILGIALAAALLCQGCASAVLTEVVRHQPHYTRPGAVRAVEGSYLGLERVEESWCYAFRFPDFVWSGPPSRRTAVVLVPAETGRGPAIVAGGDAADLRTALGRILGSGSAAQDLDRRAEVGRSRGQRVTALVRPRGPGPTPAPPPARSAAPAEYPAALEFRVGPKGQVDEVRVCWAGRRTLEWTAPVRVADHLGKPRWGERAARPLASLGYLVTVPLDVVTLPAQLAAGLLLLVALSAS